MAGYMRAAQREAQLLEAAKTVLVRDGYEGITLRSVAREAGVRLSTLQYIFHARADLVRSLSEKVMLDSGFSSHRGGVGTLGQELQAAAAWFGDSVLHDPGMRELLRAEFVANVGRAGPTADDYPAGSPILGQLFGPWLQRMADQGEERFAVPVAQLAAACTHGFVGLTYQYLCDGDPEAYRQGSEAVIAAAVALADPRPA